MDYKGMFEWCASYGLSLSILAHERKEWHVTDIQASYSPYELRIEISLPIANTPIRNVDDYNSILALYRNEAISTIAHEIGHHLDFIARNCEGEPDTAMAVYQIATEQCEMGAWIHGWQALKNYMPITVEMKQRFVSEMFTCLGTYGVNDEMIMKNVIPNIR